MGDGGGTVWIIEDHPPTARITASAFEEFTDSITTTVLGDGGECLAALEDGGGSLTWPDLMLLDLDLPGANGFDVLEARLSDPEMRRIPTIVLSGATDQTDIDRCYELGATAFLRKPEDFEGYLSIVELVVSFWLSTVVLPESGTN